MTISATEVAFTEDEMTVALEDGRRISVPLVWYPRLLSASPQQRAEVEISPYGLHWEAIDEDISVEGLLSPRAFERAAPTAAE